MNPKIAKWRRWLNVIKQQVYSAMESRFVYRETVSIILANPTLPKAGAFQERLQLWYVDSVIMAVRRQAKGGNQSISLARLMQDVRDHSALLSRKYWTGLFKGYVTEHLADGMFDNIAGAGENHLPRAIVDADLAAFRQIVVAIETWADKRIAHHDGGVTPIAPTFADLDAALDEVGNTFQKYFSVITADTIAFTTPTIQYNWKKVFTQPWIAPKAPTANRPE